MLQQTRDNVQGLNGPGQLNPADNDRVSASLYTLAKQHHFSSVDQVSLSQQTATAAAGKNIFIVQRAANDLAKQRARMSTAEAAQTPVEQSYAIARAQQPEPQVPQVQTQQVASPAQTQDPQPRPLVHAL